MKPHFMPRGYCPLNEIHVRWDPVRERVTITYSPQRPLSEVWASARESYKHYEGKRW